MALASYRLPRYRWRMPRPRQLTLFRTYAESLTAADRETVTKAINILDRSLRRHGVSLDSPNIVMDYLKLHFAGRDAEQFVVLYLDAQNRLIEPSVAFTGTLTQTTVYPREIVKDALRLGAASVILAHNHPSGVSEPSRADQYLTENLRSALALIDCRVLDHMVVAGSSHVSFAQRGLLEPRSQYDVPKL